MDKSEGGGKTSDPLPRRGELHRCGSHEARKASVRRKEVENHFFPFPGPVGSLPGGGEARQEEACREGSSLRRTRRKCAKGFGAAASGPGKGC